MSRRISKESKDRVLPRSRKKFRAFQLLQRSGLLCGSHFAESLWRASGRKFLQSRSEDRLQLRFRITEYVIDKIDSARLASPRPVIGRNDPFADRFHLPCLFRSEKGDFFFPTIYLRRGVLVGQRKIRPRSKGHGGTGACKQARQKGSAGI